MFALRRSSLRLATTLPFPRPPRISAPFSDQPPPPNPFSTPSTPSIFQTPSPPSSSKWNGLLEDTTSQNLIFETGSEMVSEMLTELTPDLTTSVLPHNHNPFGDRASSVYRLHCFSSRTNTRNTFTDPNGNAVAWFSGGSCGFKKRNRSSYEAGYQCAVRLFEKIEARAQAEAQPFTIALFFKGFGQGRDALMKAIMTEQGEEVRGRIVSITDRSPLKIGGTRARKMKRR